MRILPGGCLRPPQARDGATRGSGLGKVKGFSPRLVCSGLAGGSGTTQPILPCTAPGRGVIDGGWRWVLEEATALEKQPQLSPHVPYESLTAASLSYTSWSC